MPKTAASRRAATGPGQPWADACLDPWCIVPLGDGTEVLFGYARRHPVTGGLAWLSSTEVEELDEWPGHARTRSGRVYELGRRIDPGEVPDQGDEAWIAFELLLGHQIDDSGSVPPRVSDPVADSLWIGACKMARHLGVPEPRRRLGEVVAFRREHMVAYLRLRTGRLV